MASDFDRDNSIDRVLKGARRDLTPPPADGAGPSCLDGETLAAWADGGLDADQVRIVETHVADCARCQAMSAAFFSADEGATAASSTVVPFRAQRTNRLMYWLPIAAGTIAATLVIWMGVRGRNMPEATSAMGDALVKETASPVPSGGLGQAGTVARQEPAPAATQIPVPALAKPAESKAQERLDAVAPVDLRAERRKQEAAAAAKPRTTSLQQGQAGAAAPTVGAAAAPTPSPVPIPQPVTPVMPPPPPAVVTPTPPPPKPVQTQTATSAAAQSTSAAGVARDSAMFRSTVAQVLAEFASSDPRASTISGLPSVAGGVAGGGAGAGAAGAAAGRGGGGGGGGRGARTADVLSTPPVHWRILSSDVLEKSTDRVTWETITIAPPVQGLLHGSAPSPTVCWVAGRAGLVLLTTDGRQFTRVTAPTTSDLVSIRAVDARQATVTTTDGQTLTTSDGGKSWK